MTRIKSSIATMALAEALFRRPATTDGTGVVMLNGQWQGVPTWCKELFADAISEIKVGQVHHVAVNIILPGKGSGWHKDPTPKDDAGNFIRYARWHLPLRTNPGAWFEDEEHSKFHMAPGYWWGPVEYWMPHAVGNDGTEPRMHLICDLR